MVISTRKNFIFLAFNKTASSSIEHVLRPYQNGLYTRWLRLRYKTSYRKPVFKHIPAARLKDIVWKPYWDRCFKFAVVRNPWERLVSHYVTTDYAKNATEAEPVAFEKWILRGAKGTYSGEKSMLDFITGEDGELLVDFVARYENLEQDLEVVSDRIGIKVDIPHLNSSLHKHYKSYYSEATLEAVSEFVQKDATRFSYTF